MRYAELLMTGLTAGDVARLAQAMGVPVATERAAQCAQEVQDMLAYARELDEVIAPDVMPATVFEVDQRRE